MVLNFSHISLLSAPTQCITSIKSISHAFLAFHTLQLTICGGHPPANLSKQGEAQPHNKSGAIFHGLALRLILFIALLAYKQ